MNHGRWIDLGRVPYERAHTLQRRLVDLRADEEMPDTLLTLEHDPVLTLGRSVRGDRSRLGGVPIYEVERGGDVTYHGPGQLVGYPILLMPLDRRDLPRYLRDIEEALILALGRFGIPAERSPGLTGVWSKGLKVASIGVAVRRWVTYHGFALNVSTDLEAFRDINPCGLPGAVMTSMNDLAGRELTLGEVTPVVVEELGRVLDTRFTTAEPSLLPLEA